MAYSSKQRRLEEKWDSGQHIEASGWTVMLLAMAVLLFQLGVAALAGICQLMK